MRVLTAALCFVLLLGCVGVADDFESGVAAWRKTREANLRKSDGWLTLAGLFWLSPGENPFGSDASCLCRFPDKAPAHMGSFTLQDGKVQVTVAPGVDVQVDGHPVQSLTLDPADPEGKVVMSLGTLSWYLIARDGRLAIRVKDSASAELANFHGLKYYEPDPHFRVTGHLQVPTKPRKVAAPTAMGYDTQVDVRGTISFVLAGEPVHLLAFGDPGDPDLEVYFGDPTNGHGTYPSGRYLVVSAPSADGLVTLDFNRAYNPPCAFTPYATCTYPPKENRLPIPVEAGEKFSGH